MDPHEDDHSGLFDDPAPLNDQTIRDLLVEAQRDATSATARIALCRGLATAFERAGMVLWMGGSLVGTDRKEGKSPFRFASDATVGLATLAQIAGELCRGSVQLLDDDNRYAAAALMRQLVEVEYLAWAFAEDDAEAAEWLRASKSDRLAIWQPRHLRDRSRGRFRAADYGFHCELGGHPTPNGRQLLPDHTFRLPVEWLWLELAIHGSSAWEYLLQGVDRAGYAHPVRGMPETHEASVLAASWREGDRLSVVARSLIGRNAQAGRE